MGMCAVRGPLVASSPAEEEVLDGDATPRSTASESSDVSSSSSQELLDAREELADQYHGAALWQRTIPKGRRCRPLSFSGVIVYDASGHQLETCREDDGEGHHRPEEAYLGEELRSQALDVMALSIC